MHLRWDECTWEDIAQAAKEDYLVVFPVGGIEQHGPALPLNVDAYQAEKWALDAACRVQDTHNLNVLVLPLLPYGQSCCHMDFPGTIWLTSATHVAVLHDVMKCVAGYGFRSIVIINGHGSNIHTIQVACQDLRTELTRADSDTKLYIFPGHEHPIITTANQQLWGPGGTFATERNGIHGAAYETAQFLADRPDLVKTEKLVQPKFKREDLPLFSWRIKEMSETGAFGDPTVATAEAGALIWEAWAEGIAQFLLAISKERGSGRRP